MTARPSVSPSSYLQAKGGELVVDSGVMQYSTKKGKTNIFGMVISSKPPIPHPAVEIFMTLVFGRNSCHVLCIVCHVIM